MNTPAKKRRSRFACLALVALTLGAVFCHTPTASAQFRRGGFYGRGYGGGYYGGYRPGFYNRGFGYGGFNNGFYNRGYGGLGYGGFRGYGYGNGFYGGVPTPLASPIAVPNYGYGSYYGGIGGFY